MESGRVASLGRAIKHARITPASNTARLIPLFLLLEGKRELESLISDGNAEH